jgi:hypothetical protein
MDKLAHAPSLNPRVEPRRRLAAAWVLFGIAGLLATLAVYWPTLNYGFSYDDYYLVRPHTADDLRRALVGSWYPKDVMVPFYRPLTVAFHAARFELFHFDPRLYHWLSVVLFGAVAALVGLITRRLVAGTGFALLAVAATAGHPNLPYALVAWTTNQMHLLQSIIVLLALMWWVTHRTQGTAGWLPLLGFQIGAFLVKEDGVMLLPCLVVLEILFARMIEGRRSIPPIPFLVGAVLTLGALIWLRTWALGGLGGYAHPDWARMQANFGEGLSRALLYQPFDRAGKSFVGYTVITITAVGLLASWLRKDLRRAGFLILGGFVIAAAFNVPFVFVTKREQLYLLALGGTLAFSGGVAAIWLLLQNRSGRLVFAILLLATLVVSGRVTRQMAADFEPYGPTTLAYDEIVQGWASVPPEIHEFLARKRRLWNERRERLQLPDDLPQVTFGAYPSEIEPSGQDFRWTTRTTTMFLRSSGSEVWLPLRAFPHPTGAASVRVHVAEQLQHAMTIRSGGWVSVPIRLRPLRMPWRMHVIRLEVDPAWVPAERDSRSSDQRELGVKIGRLETTPRPQIQGGEASSPRMEEWLRRPAPRGATAMAWRWRSIPRPISARGRSRRSPARPRWADRM